MRSPVRDAAWRPNFARRRAPGGQSPPSAVRVNSTCSRGLTKLLLARRPLESSPVNDPYLFPAYRNNASFSEFAEGFSG